MKDVDEWMVRTSQNWIAGPYKSEQLRQLIQQGQLVHSDEICKANVYWFYLHEKEELMKQLGIEVPNFRDSESEEDEITETGTDTVTSNTDFTPTPTTNQTTFAKFSARHQNQDADENTPIPDLEEMDDTADAQALMQNRALRQFQPPKRIGALPSTPPKIFTPQIYRSLEPASRLRFIIGILILCLVMVIGMVFMKVFSHP